MGYLPIIITLSGFIGLFFLVVNQSMIAKKKAILQIQQALFEGFERLGFAHKREIGLHPEAFKTIEAQYQKAKSHEGSTNGPLFKNEIQPVFQSFKITISQYNKLITKKPYSFVAKLMGHKHLG
jgi:hypothetical protein